MHARMQMDAWLGEREKGGELHGPDGRLRTARFGNIYFGRLDENR